MKDPEECSRGPLTKQSKLKRTCYQHAVTQAVAGCCLNGLSSGCWSGANQATKNHGKGDCLKVPERSYLSATLPGRRKPEE